MESEVRKKVNRPPPPSVTKVKCSYCDHVSWRDNMDQHIKNKHPGQRNGVYRMESGSNQAALTVCFPFQSSHQ